MTKVRSVIHVLSQNDVSIFQDQDKQDGKLPGYGGYDGYAGYGGYQKHAMPPLVQQANVHDTALSGVLSALGIGSHNNVSIFQE
ncbi:MAG: hypothetical protein PHW10_05175 [Candidatus Peribacteraceae bacterium]|nr:hypothetical protein [Candidatus Peribacteraceae bacterium]